jgi:SAM-dependent methyltransferase
LAIDGSRNHMIQMWKAPHIVKGILTHVPALNTWRAKRSTTGGSNSSRYCYAVWLRHLTLLGQQGFEPRGAAVGELGPGDSIGTGLAALLSGAGRYVGLDVVPYSAKADLQSMLKELAGLYCAGEPIPDHDEFPRIRPRLASYEFPHHLVRPEFLPERVARLESVLRSTVAARGPDIAYLAPWASVSDLEPGSLDLVFSQAVLQCVDDLEETYQAMFTWLKPGGYGSHRADFGANHYSPFWNGHWAYTDLEWRLLRGRRKTVLNRQPLSAHLCMARKAGFEVLYVDAEHDRGGLAVDLLAPRFRRLAIEDRLARGVMLILRKPKAAKS